jgi:serine/threonine protein kinase
MTTARDLSVDQLARMVESGSRLTTWYAQGHTDGFGDRLLMFDNTNAPSWEILRFKPVLARQPKFETALRQRIEQLSSFQHPAFPLVRSINELGHEHGLAVVSTYVSGFRLSDALKKPRSADFALQLIRQLMPALSALHQHAPGIAHGALTPDRVVLAADGRLMMREHMLESAIASLELTDLRLWSEFGVATPPSRVRGSSLDGRSDVYQLALVALSLIAGRPMTPDDYPDAVRELLDTIVRFTLLRRWLERALQLTADAFESAQEANAALAELRDEPGSHEDGFEATLRLALPQEVRSSIPAVGLESESSRASANAVSVHAPYRRMTRVLRWAAVAVGVVALGEAAFIGRLLFIDPDPQPTTAAVSAIQSLPRSVPEVLANDVGGQVVTPAVNPMPEAPAVPAGSVVPAVVSVREDRALRDVPVPPAGDPLPAAGSTRSGGFRVSAPIELHVLDGERLLGSSRDGPIIAPAGRHQFDFVNSVIGYRVRREVDIKPGQIASLSIAIPNGTLNVNATPWAAVWIDGTPYGETPLGNLSIVPGEHEIVFRHPQLGERREKAIVRPDLPGRVAVNMQR